ncbi:hypothetical protein EDB86DRAFT_2840630 [Lactarius hatsudake]|nr:hypothetical protein EDB86DRAFT_2840630 [Lactarius hatsudake]
MPYFPGLWFAKRDNTTENGLFEASMLALLKPWHSLSTLKTEEESFRHAFDKFMSHTADNVRTTVSNIEFFHQCSDSTRSHRESGEQEMHTDDRSDPLIDSETGTVLNTENITTHNAAPFNDLLTEEEIFNSIDKPFTGSAKLYADKAITIGVNSGVLSETMYSIPYQKPANRASLFDIDQFHSWKTMLTTTNHDEDITQSPITSRSLECVSVTNNSDILMRPLTSEPSVLPLIEKTVQALPSIPQLNDQQTMVHDIICNHLRASLNGENPPQHLMIVHGQGGTGKSALLNTISKSFEDMGTASSLANLIPLDGCDIEDTHSDDTPVRKDRQLSFTVDSVVSGDCIENMLHVGPISTGISSTTMKGKEKANEV